MTLRTAQPLHLGPATGKAVAKRAADEPSQTGVIVVALGAERGETVFELVRNELVNQLILDDAAAAGLGQRIDTA